MPNKKTIKESEKIIPIRAEVDVLVAGGGLAGVSAAVAAARAGAKTMLIEKKWISGRSCYGRIMLFGL